MSKSKWNKIWAYIIGTGLVLFAIHNPLQPAIEYVFFPVLGLTFSLLGMTIILQDNWKRVTLGSRWVYIPLIIIASSVTLSASPKLFSIPAGETTHFIGFALACLLFSVYLFGLYLVARLLGRDLLVPFTWAVVIGSLGCIGYGIAFPGIRGGGLISPTNYDIAAGLLIIGTVVSIWQRQWVLTAVAIVGLFFTGAEEGLFAIGVLVVVMLIRRDWGWKVLAPVGALAITLVICTPLGITEGLYFPAAQKIEAATSAITAETPEERDKLLDKATNTRWLTAWKLSPIKPFGNGFNMTAFYEEIPHNIVLIIIEQVGIAAAIAWCFVTGWCLIKTKWKYTFVAILALGVFDHYLWTQIAPWWWCLVGVSSASNIKSDLIFRKER